MTVIVVNELFCPQNHPCPPSRPARKAGHRAGQRRSPPRASTRSSAPSAVSAPRSVACSPCRPTRPRSVRRSDADETHDAVGHGAVATAGADIPLPATDAATTHTVLVEPVGLTVMAPSGADAARQLRRRRSRCARRLRRARHLRQVPRATGRRRAHAADRGRAPQAVARAARTGLAAGLPGEASERPGQHRVQRDRRTAADPHGLETRPRQARPAVVKETRRAAAGRLRRRAQRPRTRLRGAPGRDARSLSVLRTLPDVLREDGFTATRHPLRRRADRRGAARGRRRSPTAPPSTSAPPRSSPTCSTCDDGRLIDQEAVENPQMRFGEDVVTRITQAVQDGRLVRAGRARPARA